MSEILIRGFSFPEDCSKCPLRKVSQMREDLCVISGCRVPNYPERPSWCYLHEIKPHGRLIDADLWLSTHWVSQQVIDAIKNAPTVLEASPKLEHVKALPHEWYDPSEDGLYEKEASE